MKTPELSKASKIVMGYFFKTSKATPPNQSTIESMLLIVQMDGHNTGYNEGYNDAETHRAEDEAGADL